MAVVIMVIVIRVAVVMMIIIMVAVIIIAAAVMAPGKGSEKNPEKSSLRRKGRFPSGFLIRNRACIRVISIFINISPA